MKARLAHALIVTLALGTAAAQQLDAEPQEPAAAAENPADESETPPTEEASTGQPADEPPADEVSENPAADHEDKAADETAAEEESAPAEDATPVEENDPGDEKAIEDADEPLADEPVTDEAVAEAPIEEAPTAPQPGLAVRVERQQGGSGAIDPSQVKLLAPFPAKLLAQVPAGWRIEKAGNAPPFTREVALAPGSAITLSVKPHILVPEADGEGIFAVPEPGYNAALGYRQNATVGAILATSIRQLDEDARQLGGAIDQLQQLLVSLPQPEPAAQENPAPARQR